MLDKIANFLTNVRGVVYVLWQGDRLPNVSSSTITFFGLNKSGESSEQFVLSFEELPKVLTLLRVTALEKKLIVIFYDVKPMLSSAGWYLERQRLSTTVLNLPDANDLMLREKFLGLDKPAPRSCREAIKRLSECKTGREIHRAIHVPLLSVIPLIERSGVIRKTEESTKIVYPLYEIEGQANGRLNCSSPSDNNYNPHIIDEELRASLLPPGYERVFIVADFKALEFVVLAHISSDENMIADSSTSDPYIAALRRMFNKSEISPEYRNMAKDIFLPVFYGKTPPVLARDLGCSIELAEKIHQEIRIMYPKAYGMVAEAERFAGEKGFYQDFLGRIRYFDGNQLAARNMVAQASSAMFCQERLISMCNAVKVIAKIHASIHDGFLLSCKESDLSETIKYIKFSLESVSEIIPGLKASVKISSGTGLDNLTEVRDDIVK